MKDRDGEPGKGKGKGEPRCRVEAGRGSRGKPKSEKKQKRKGAKGVKVEFVLFAPHAGDVCLAGSFNGWVPGLQPLKRHKDGRWKAKVELPAGRHEYKFVADGRWVEELPGVEAVPNEHGTQNFVVWAEGKGV
jgi:1,4-alpha-glucan branching enzyme